MTPEQLDIISRLGTGALLAAAVIAFFREWVVPGSRIARIEAAHKEEIERERGEKAALQARLDAATAAQAQLIQQQSFIIEQSLPALRAYQGAKP